MGTTSDNKSTHKKKIPLQADKQQEMNYFHVSDKNIENEQSMQQNDENDKEPEDQDAPNPISLISNIAFKNINNSEIIENNHEDDNKNKINNNYNNNGLKMYDNKVTPNMKNQSIKDIDENPYNENENINKNDSIYESNFFLFSDSRIKFSQQEINVGEENKQMKLYTNSGEEEMTPKPVNNAQNQEKKLPSNIEEIMNKGFIPIFISVKNYDAEYTKCFFAKKNMRLFKVIEEYESQMKIKLKDYYCYLNGTKLEKGKSLEDLKVEPFSMIVVEKKK